MSADEVTGPVTGLDAVLRRVPAQARSRDKVARALEAADVIARRDGVEALTLPRVAAEAGVSVGALHQYLPDRVAITAAIVARYHARFEQLVDDAVAELPQGHVEDPVGEVVRRFATVYREEAAVPLLRGAVPVSPEARAAHKQRMVEKVRLLLEATGVAQPSPEVARVVFTAADAVMHEAFASSDPEPLLAELDALLRRYLQPALVPGA